MGRNREIYCIKFLIFHKILLVIWLEKDFIKEMKVIDRRNVDTYKELMENINKIKKNLERDYNNLQFVEDRNLVDYYTYKIKSEEAKYDYLLKEAKKVETGIYL